MGALTSDTPVMTDKGFKYLQNLSIGDKVMTYTEDGSKEWNKIYNIIPKIAPDKVYKITLDNNYQFKVTDNHKLPTNEGVVKSEDLKVGIELYDYVDEPFIPIDDYKAEFMGVFLADGYIRDSERINGRSSNKIEFHIKQEWKKDKIIKLCLLNGYKYELIERENDNTYTIYVNEKELRNQLNECYNYKGNKHFPTWIWNDKNVIANVIKGLMFDGRKGSKVRWDWSCSDLPLVIDVLYALSYIGRVSTIYVDDRKGDTGNWRTNYRISFGLDYKPKNKTKIKSIELVDNDEMVYDLSIENNHNYVCGLGGIHSKNCRTALPDNFTGVYDLDCLNTGNFAYTTLNLPLLALEADGNVDRFYELLDKYCDIARKGLLNRRELVKDIIYNKHMSDFLLQRDKVTGIPLYDIDRTTITLGFCGLYECMKILNYNFGENIIQFINTKVKEYKLDDGLRWSVIASPAESASHRFAMIIKDKYPEVELQGTDGYFYLTNSSHIPVSHESDIVAHIRNADKYHPLTKGGNILHVFLGESYHDPIAIWRLNKKILATNTNFWAFTNDFTYCNNCHNTFNKALDNCSICGSDDLTVYSRITGYFVPVKNWNNGKKQEFKDRYRHSEI
jgi:ribosomal protein S8